MPVDAGDRAREPIMLSPRPTPSSSGFFESQFPSSRPSSTKPASSQTTDTSAACIIAFEVVFSVFVFGIVAGCYVFGMRRRRRHRELEHERQQQYAQAQSACNESMLERALERHERRMLHMLDPYSRQSSSMTASTNNTATNVPPLPPYWPPDPTLRLPDQAVTRLSQALMMAQMARVNLPLFHDPPSYPSSSSAAPPKYDDIYRQPSRTASRLSLPYSRPQHTQSTHSLPSVLPEPHGAILSL